MKHTHTSPMKYGVSEGVLSDRTFCRTVICYFLAALFSADSYALTDVLKIKIAKGNYSDEIAIRFMAGATTGFDGCCDAWKLFSSNPAVPNHFTKTPSGDKLSINAMPPFTASVTTDVFLKIDVADTYSITPEEFGPFSPDVCIRMLDIATGQTYNMRTATTFTVALGVIAITDPARFRVLFSYPASIQSIGASCTNCADGSAAITKAGESNWQYSVINSSGNNIASGISASSSETISGLAVGNYTVTISSDFMCSEVKPFTIEGPVTYYSRASGNWSDVNTWSTAGCGGAIASTVPGAANNVVICAGNNITIDASANCIDLVISGTLSANAAFSVSGNWANSGTFTAGTYSVTFSGARIQTISGSSSTVFNNLLINNSAPAQALRLNVPVIVNGILGLKDGHIITTSANILSCGTSASVSLLAAQQDSSFVKGPMSYLVNTNSGVTKIFPVGKGNSYRRIDLTVDQKLSIATTYTAEMIDNSAQALGYSFPPTISNVSYVRYHTITQSPATTKIDMAQVRVYFGCAGVDDQVETLPAISVAKDNGSAAWLDLTDTPSGFSCGATTNWGNALSGNFTSFTGEKFTLTNTGNPDPLSVSLTDFNAKPVGENVAVSWTTESETNNDYFTVERAAPPNLPEGEEFEFVPIGTVNGAGNSPTIRSYEFIDESPFPLGRVGDGLLYYRLKQTDYDGKYEYFGPISISIRNMPFGVNVYPNPTSGKFYLSLSPSPDGEGRGEVEIHNVFGEKVYTSPLSPLSNWRGAGGEVIDVSSQPSGIYFLNVKTANEMFTQHIIITN